MKMSVDGKQLLQPLVAAKEGGDGGGRHRIEWKCVRILLLPEGVPGS